jgi:hypothetical protein
MKYLIVNGWKIIKTCDSLRGAKISYSRKYKKLYPDALIVSEKEFREKEPMVETINMMSGKVCKIPASQKGGCCDPGTERYWTM